MSVLNRPYFHDEKAAFEHLEEVLWPNGPVCPHCGNSDKHYKLEGVRSKPSKKNPGGVERFGLYKCGVKACRKQFTVRVGTVFASSHVPLHKWLQAVYLLCSSKKGISAHQLHRILEVQYKTAWFMAHRIREAMRSKELSPLGGEGKTVEADETFIGRKKNWSKGKGGWHKHKVLALVERGGSIRSIHIASITRHTVETQISENVSRESRLMTDTAPYYRRGGLPVADHHMVDHSKKEYVRGDVHVNTLESYFSLFKRGMRGVYQHCAEKHLHRYLAEFDFRYNNRVSLGVGDNERAINALCGTVGRRLMYRDSFA